MALSAAKFHLTVQKIARGGASGTGLLLNADTLKLALFTAATAPVLATDISYSTTLAGGSAEVSNGNGYTTGGNTCGAGITANSSGTETLSTTQEAAVWTASGAGFALRYFLLYDDTASSKWLLMEWDYGSTLTLSGANADTLTVTGPDTSYATLA